jgi:putative peptidoglycan lipid II flippase
LASRILGLVRDIACAAFFGSGLVWDAFGISFMLPNLFRRLFGEGALSAAFIPVFSEYLETEGEDEAWRAASACFLFFATILLALVIIGETALIFLMRLKLPPKYALVVRLLMVLWPYLFFICLVALLAALLQSLKNFLVPALAPIVLNLCWIAGVILIAPRMSGASDRQIFGVALAILAAGFLQLAMQITALVRRGARLTLLRPFYWQALKRVFLLMGPMLLGLAALQVNVLSDWAIAFFLVKGEGAVSALYWGNRLMQFPLALLGIAVATAAFPTFSQLAARGDLLGLGSEAKKALRFAFFLAFPAGIGLCVLAAPLIRLFFQWKNFDAVATDRAARVLIFYSLGIWAYSSVHILNRALYSLKDTKTPVRIAVGMMFANLALNLTLVWPLREAGLALATAITQTAQAIFLYLALRGKVAIPEERTLLRSAGRVLFAAGLMGTMTYFVASKFPASPHLAGRIAALASPLLVGLITYFAVAYFLKAPEPRELVGLFRKHRA